MKNSPEILYELMSVSQLLAGLEKVNVFTVPEGYFNDLDLRIANYALLNNGSAADDITSRNLQQVPVGYFDSLSNAILAKVKAATAQNAAEEIVSISPIIADLKSKNVFTVPQYYFDSLAEDVTKKVMLNESAAEGLNPLSPMLSALKNKNVFTVPQNYFDSLAEEIIKKSKAVNDQSFKEELISLSPVLHSLKHINVFTLPDNYFESLTNNVIEKIKPQPAKVLSIKSRSWLRYAAAAVITGAIAFSSLQLFNTSSQNKNNTQSTVASAALPGYIKASFQYKTEDELNAGIAKLSDDEIAKYLENNGNALDNEMLTNNTDVSELPSQADYLKDENALNEYLDKIDKETNNN